MAGRVQMLGGKCGGAEAGVSELRAHFRETHLFSLSSPDGEKSFSQDPADCLHWEYTQIVDACTRQSNNQNPRGLMCTAQTTQTPPVISQDMYVVFLFFFLANLLHFLGNSKPWSSSSTPGGSMGPKSVFIHFHSGIRCSFAQKREVENIQR